MSMRLVVDFESQNRHSPGYSLKKRGIYYCARMLNDQLPAGAGEQGYDSLEKVYSLWLVTDAPLRVRDTVRTYTLRDMAGHTDAECDLLSLVFIYIHIGHGYTGEDEAFRFLYSVFSEDDTELRSCFREEEYNQIREVRGRMGKPHEALRAAYESAGMEKGMEKGIEKGIVTVMDTAMELGAAPEKAVKMAASKYERSEEEIIRVYKEYKKQKPLT